MEWVVCEFMGFFVEIEVGNKYIIVIFDYFFKCIEMYFLKNIEV